VTGRRLLGMAIVQQDQFNYTLRTWVLSLVTPM
jgi:hypothetical protein